MQLAPGAPDLVEAPVVDLPELGEYLLPLLAVHLEHRCEVLQHEDLVIESGEE